MVPHGRDPTSGHSLNSTEPLLVLEALVADVLIVDDDPSVLALLEVLVDRLGHDVRTCSNAEDALLQSALKRPDLLLLDISLPGRNGDELLDLLMRGIGKPRSLVFVSAHPIHVVRETAGRYDAAFLHKPFDTDEFDRVVEEALAEVERTVELDALEDVDATAGSDGWGR